MGKHQAEKKITEKEDVGASVARRRQLLEDEEQEEYEDNNNTNEVDESAVMDAIEERVGIFGRKSRPSSENCHQASVGEEESDEWEQLRTRDVGADWTEPRVCEQALGG